MIKTNRELQVSRAQVATLEVALEKARASKASLDPALRSATCAALESQLQDLRSEIEHYESLRDGKLSRLVRVGLRDLPNALIRARIASNLTQRELGERVGIKEQQVQRYEANGYQGVSFERLLQIAESLGLNVVHNVEFTGANAGRARKLLQKRGFSESFLARRLWPAHEGDIESSPTGAAEALRRVKEVFGWDESALAGSPLVPATQMGDARFKRSRAANADYLEAYAAYAYHLALGAERCARKLPKGDLAIDWRIVREKVRPLTFRSLIVWAWSCGAVVIPLLDQAAFHGAFWRIEGRNVIVLKQRSQSLARWSHDILHELYHAAQEPMLLSRGRVESDSDVDQEEDAAVLFASNVLLGGQANELALECAQESAHSIPRMKSAVEKVAQRAQVDIGSLANHVAWVLSRQQKPINWWATAETMQLDNRTDLSWAMDYCFEHLEPPPDSDLNVELLFRALRDRGES